MGIVERAEENACAMGKIKKMKNIMLDGPTTWMLIIAKNGGEHVYKTKGHMNRKVERLRE